MFDRPLQVLQEGWQGTQFDVSVLKKNPSLHMQVEGAEPDSRWEFS